MVVCNLFCQQACVVVLDLLCQRGCLWSHLVCPAKQWLFMVMSVPFSYVFGRNQASLPAPFCSALVPVSVFIALSSVFHSINSPNNPPLSHSVLPVVFCLIGPFNDISLF